MRATETLLQPSVHDVQDIQCDRHEMVGLARPTCFLELDNGSPRPDRQALRRVRAIAVLYRREGVLREPGGCRSHLVTEVGQIAFTGQFDANCYLYLSRASDFFDVAEHGASVDAALSMLKVQRALIIGVKTDFLFPIYQQRELAEGLEAPGREVEFVELNSLQGHDSFLVDMDSYRPIVAKFFA